VSFILDALRKSEHARQRQTGPGLAEVQVAAVRPRTNAWATAAIVLLLVNLVAVGVVLLRRAQHDAAPATSSATVTTPPAATANPTLAAPVVQAPVSQMPGVPASAPVLRPAPPPPAPARNPLADEVGADDFAAERQAAAAAVPDGPAAVTRSPNAKRGSVVYAPAAIDAAPEPLAAPGPAVEAAAPAAEQILPNADEIAPQAGLPALHLDLHVYSNQVQQRFVFVNSRKYREGDTLAEGPVVERITPDGAVLNFQGSRFKLSND
jgi:general secretion pathway protein B